MPQLVTYSVNAKVDKGPDVKSESKVEVASYSAVLDEVICRCSSDEIELNLDSKALGNLDTLVISADKYANEKECVPKNGSQPSPCRNLEYWICSEKGYQPSAKGSPNPSPSCAQPTTPQQAAGDGSPKGEGYVLSRPHVIPHPFLGDLFKD